MLFAEKKLYLLTKIKQNQKWNLPHTLRYKLELHLISESRIKNKTVESWSSKDKNVTFL